MNTNYFTFHYVSINTCRVFCIASTTSFFTFHYVSINTMCIWILPDGYRTLHSTMFLLIQTASQISELMKAALHSTMFLLIPAPLNHRLILPYYTIFCRPWYFLSFYLFRYNTVHRKHYFAYVFHVCRPLVILSLSQVDNHKMKLVRSSFLPQNSLSIHFS